MGKAGGWTVGDADTRTSTTLLGRVAATGDEAACTEFVNRYGAMVRAIARACGLPAEDCDDVAQEVMIAAVDALRDHRYDRQRGRFKRWLKGVIYNKINTLRASRARARIRATSPSTPIQGAGHPSVLRAKEIPDPHPSPAEQFEAEFEDRWQQVAFDEALDEVRREVDPATYQAFDLYARKNRPAREVARLLGISRNAVYVAKSRILARIREKIGNPDDRAI